MTDNTLEDLSPSPEPEAGIVAQPMRSPLDGVRRIVVAYHTSDSLYVGEAQRLRRSLDRLGLRYCIVQIRDEYRGWDLATHYKAHFLSRMRRQFPAADLLYVDADAVVHSDPWQLADSVEGDFAVFRRTSGELVSATILVRPTNAADNLIQLWHRLNRSDLATWDQRLLDRAIRKMQLCTCGHALFGHGPDGCEEILCDDPCECLGYTPHYDQQIKVGSIPAELCCIFDLGREESPGICPVIEQMQASRTYKHVGGSRERARMNRIVELRESGL